MVQEQKFEVVPTGYQPLCTYIGTYISPRKKQACKWWRCGVMVIVLALSACGREFDSCVVRTCMQMSWLCINTLMSIFYYVLVMNSSGNWPVNVIYCLKYTFFFHFATALGPRIKGGFNSSQKKQKNSQCALFKPPKWLT